MACEWFESCLFMTNGCKIQNEVSHFVSIIQKAEGVVVDRKVVNKVQAVLLTLCPPP